MTIVYDDRDNEPHLLCKTFLAMSQLTVISYYSTLGLKHAAKSNSRAAPLQIIFKKRSKAANAARSAHNCIGKRAAKASSCVLSPLMKHAEAGQGTISGTPVNYAKIHNWLVKQEVPVCISFSVCTLHSLPFIPSKLHFLITLAPSCLWKWMFAGWRILFRGKIKRLGERVQKISDFQLIVSFLFRNHEMQPNKIKKIYNEAQKSIITIESCSYT